MNEVGLIVVVARDGDVTPIGFGGIRERFNDPPKTPHSVKRFGVRPTVREKSISAPSGLK